MIVNIQTGRVAFHALLLSPDPDKGSEVVQYDYSGEPLGRLLTKDEVLIDPLTKRE
jgi:hypothetical protein